MIPITTKAVGFKDHYNIFRVLKNGGFFKLSDTLGLKIEMGNGYAIYKLMAVGEQENIQNVVWKEPKKKVVVEKEAKIKQVGTEDVFG